jgi:chromosome segregation ATPase
MRIVKQIAAVVVMVLSGLLLLGLLAGIVGVRILRSDLIQSGNDLAQLTENSLQRAENGVIMLRAQVDQSQAAVNTALGSVEAVGNKVEQTSLVLVVAEQLLDKDLTPGVQRMHERASELRDTIAFIDSTLNVVLRLPFNRDNRRLQLADAVIERLKVVDQRVQEISQAVSNTKSRVTDTAENALTVSLQRADTALGNLNDGLDSLQGRLNEERAQVPALHAQFNQIVAWTAIGLTVGFLWMALAQLALFVHAYGLLTGRDPLARWHTGHAQESA